MNISWLKADNLKSEVKKRLKPAEIILDIGCGIRPQKLIIPRVHLCCEPFGQYIAHLLGKVIPGAEAYFVILQTRWEEVINILPAKSVDTIFLIDVVEHLAKPDGLKLLKPTEKIARCQLVIFTPLGFFPQKHSDGKDAWGYEGGDWQTHRSGWCPDDFDQTWDIYACKDYHKTDNMKNKLKKPIGAFWAIKTL